MKVCVFQWLTLSMYWNDRFDDLGLLRVEIKAEASIQEKKDRYLY